MITPTIGRIVWYRPGPCDEFVRDGQPLAAILTRVHGDRVVDLTVFGYGIDGRPTPKQEVRLRQPEDEADVNPYCEWMPFQVGQAQKTQALEKELQERPA